MAESGESRSGGDRRGFQEAVAEGVTTGKTKQRDSGGVGPQ
jgi:hypothetical protein